ELLGEIERFQAWAATYPVEGRSGEWEVDYADWGPLYGAVLQLVGQKGFNSWSSEEQGAVLYAIARDNEAQYLSREIRERAPDLLLELAQASISTGEPDAKWQFAEELGRLDRLSARVEQLLLILAVDGNEYDRRLLLGALARIGSSATERIALDEWRRPDESQEWARMMALWALHRVRSPHLNQLLSLGEGDARPYLANYAAKLRHGEVEP
ncbi:MAG TPA: hypothetical protein VHY37_10735, partial [Tepidisphaeraceae bacterium]|nr:hypothetical protein [Tepidisphaeraceae bacterium]